MQDKACAPLVRRMLRLFKQKGTQTFVGLVNDWNSLYELICFLHGRVVYLHFPGSNVIILEILTPLKQVKC